MNILDHPIPGCLLIAEPFLGDMHFEQAVILLISHDEEGSAGLILNRIYSKTLGEITSLFGDWKQPLYHGGPVEEDKLFFLHSRPDLFPQGIPVNGHLFWGGQIQDFDEIVRENRISPNEIKFFVGYSGWSAGQLYTEMKERSWIAVKPDAEFNPLQQNTTDMWKTLVKQMGGDYLMWANAPIDPGLN